MPQPDTRQPLPRVKTAPPYDARTWTIMIVLLLAAAAYGGFYLKRGWIPHDDGSFALAAERVLQGQLPHRDFDDLYTGGLTLLNAAAMKVFGINLASIRYPSFILFLAWVPAVFNIARRFLRDNGAALVTSLAIALSFPNYSSAVPSWYNLFFATFGIVALFRFAETRRRRELFLAGACAGISFLAKIAGIYFLAAIFLFLIHHEQETDRLEDTPSGLGLSGWLLTIATAVLAIGLLKLTNWNRDPRYLIHFVVPSTALAASLVWREASATYQEQRFRFKRLLADSVPVLLGFLLPIALLLIPYLASGSLHSWIEGVFVLPAKRLTYASREPASLKWVNLLAPALLASGLLYARNAREPLSRVTRLVIGVILSVAVIVAMFQKGTYHFLWYALVLLIPITVGIIALSRRTSSYVFALAATAALCSLVQYPYAAPIYLVYVLPLVVLVWTAYTTETTTYSRFLSSALAITYLGFFVLLVTPSYVNAMGLYYTGLEHLEKLDLPRAGGIRVNPSQASEYNDAITTVRQHRSGEYTFAAIDAPEIYFLSGLKSPTRSLFDFFEASEDHDHKILADLDAHSINVVTLKRPQPTSLTQLGTPSFSSALGPNLVFELRMRYPNSRRTGHFEVRWKQ